MFDTNAGHNREQRFHSYYLSYLLFNSLLISFFRRNLHDNKQLTPISIPRLPVGYMLTSYIIIAINHMPCRCAAWLCKTDYFIFLHWFVIYRYAYAKVQETMWTDLGTLTEQ